MRMPLSKPGGAKFRGPTSSEEYNSQEDRLYADLVSLFQEHHTEKRMMKEAYENVLYENMALQKYLTDLEESMTALQAAVESFQDNHSLNKYSVHAFIEDMFGRHPFDYEMSQKPCLVDPWTQQVMPPKVQEISKLVMRSKINERVIPSTLSIKTGRTNEGGMVNENDMSMALDGKATTFWKREVAYERADAPNAEDITIEVSLPLQMVNDLNINEIVIDPHPEHSVEVTNIEMHYNNNWNPLPGFNQSDARISNKKHKQRTRWLFEKTLVQKVRITLRQDNPLFIDGKHVFVLGLKHLDINLSTFDQDGGYVYTKLDMSGTPMYSLHKVDHFFLNSEALSFPGWAKDQLNGHVYEYEVFKEENGDLALLKESDWSHLTEDTLWVKTILNTDPTNQTPPILHRIEACYSKS